MQGDVLCLSHLRWGFVYQRPNHLMSRCAQDHRVFFVEEPLHEATATPHLTLEQVKPNLHVVVPRLPHGTSSYESERLQRDLLDRLVRDAKVRSPLLWLYTPMALGFARHLRPSLTVYDCMDELSGFHGAPPLLRERERELFEVADLVFTGGLSLYEAKRMHHPRVHAFPSSVDAAHFSKARTRITKEPADQRSIPHPRLGFFGVIDERMDLDLLEKTARARPAYHFVIVGPIAKIDPACLPRLSNIHYLGPKKYDELPAYLAGWDVATMPFALNEATRYISPTKTLEYLAAGKPVVSTPIHDVVRPYGEEGLVRIARTAGELVRELDAALAERDTAAFASRRASCDAWVARTSWDRTWTHMRSLIREALQRRGDDKTETQETPCSTI